MFTRLRIKNFKRFKEVDIELGSSVVFIGPNNSGKTSALQALALWDVGLRKWNEKRKESKSKERIGAPINRKDVLAAPVPDSILLWRDLHVRKGAKGENRTQNVRIDIDVEGVTNDKKWQCGFEFDYSNEESISCRPLRKPGFESKSVKEAEFTEVPAEALQVRIAYLPPMSGLAAQEFRKERGEINVMIGEGQTAQILRNICYQIYSSDGEKSWTALKEHMKDLFGVTLQDPEYLSERAEIRMTYYQNNNEKKLDLASAGRGFHQTLLLLAYLYANPKTVLLLDEPDAHLEILRQRQIYQMITDLAQKQGSQIIAASHSEVVLNEAADRDIVIAFVGKPHRIDDRGSQVLKSLKDIGFDQYYQAEQKGWVLYLEGATDLSILQTFAKNLGHPAVKYLERPFVQYVENKPSRVKEHFWGLKEAKQNLVGVALFDRLEKDSLDDLGAKGLQWKKKEIENYLCMESVLIAYAKHDQPDDLFGHAEANRREQAMKETIIELTQALKTLKRPDPWSSDIKATDDFLNPLFEEYFKKLKLPNLLRKTDYHILASLVPIEKINSEVIEKLDIIAKTASEVEDASQ